MKRPFYTHHAVLALGFMFSISSARAGDWKVNTPMPPLESFGVNGILPNLKGKVVYLDFWASWCAPCKASFPILNRWQTEFGPKGFTVLGISVDESPAEMQAFLKKLSVEFPVVHDSQHKVVASAEVTTMPTAFLIDRKGVIRLVHNGFRAKDETELAAKITALLAEH